MQAAPFGFTKGRLFLLIDYPKSWPGVETGKECGIEVAAVLLFFSSLGLGVLYILNCIRHLGGGRQQCPAPGHLSFWLPVKERAGLGKEGLSVNAVEK